MNPDRVFYAIRTWKDYLLLAICLIFASIAMLALLKGDFSGDSYWTYIFSLAFFGLPAIIFVFGLIVRWPRLELFPDKVVLIDFFGLRRTVCTKVHGKAHPFVLRFRFNAIPQVGFLTREHEQALADAGRKVSKLNFDKTLSLQFLVPHDRLDEVIDAIESTRGEQKTEKIDAQTSERLAAYLLRRRRRRNLAYVAAIVLAVVAVALFEIYVDA